MRVLLDECVPRQLARHLPGFEVRTTREMGWAGVKNGALVELASSQFDTLFTVDKDFAGTSAPAAANLGIVILVAGTTDPAFLAPHMAAVVTALQQVRPGHVLRVGA
jgi:predicted nuclease of predicted toxin-antitoxin system